MKPSQHPQCPTCRGINVRGKWYSEKEGLKRVRTDLMKKAEKAGRPGRRFSLPELAQEACPACLQLRDHYAGGVVELHGDRWKENQDVIDHTIHNTEKLARLRNDQERLLWVRVNRGVAKYYVTLPDLARQIATVLEKTFKGKAEFHRSTEEAYLRIVWKSDFLSPRQRGTRSTTTRNKLHKSRKLRNRGVSTA